MITKSMTLASVAIAAALTWSIGAADAQVMDRILSEKKVKIALVQGGASVEYAKENFPKAQHVTLSTGNLLAPFVEVTAGRADVGIEDAWQAKRYAKDHPEVTDLFDGRPYNVLPIAWAIKRGN